jgi:extradiol dioxygenase family protein
VRFVYLRLAAPAAQLAEVTDFYGAQLGLEQDAGAFAVGETTLEFVGGAGEPFYHFALLVPGDRSGAALAWARERVDLLTWRGSDEVDFDFWDAKACYFHDPAGNIVELIAHRGLEENGERGDFRGDELVGLSELGLVGGQPMMAATLRDQLGLEVWGGSVDDGLAFVGEKARTLILAPPGWRWMPTGRPAERHAVEAHLADAQHGEATLEDGLHRIRA